MDKDKTDRCDFVKLIIDFTKDVLTTFPELADNLNENLRKLVILEEGSTPDEDCVDYVWNKCAKVYPPRFFDILYQNAELFDDDNKENVYFLPGIDFRKLWKQDITDKTRDTIWKYLQLILLRVVSETSEERSFGDTAKLFEAMDENALKDKLEQTIKDMEGMFSGAGAQSADGENDSGSSTGVDISNIGFGDLPNPDDLHSHISGLMKGKLGRLAQEIAEETAQELGQELGDIKSADQVFHKLFKNPGKLMSLVKNVGSKLEEKIKSGEIKESELIQEAGEFVKNMKDMPGLGNLKNMFGQMGMPGLGKDMKVNMGALNGLMRGAQTRDRLRAKLAKKQQEKAEQQNTQSGMQTSKFSTGEKVEKSSRNPAANASVNDMVDTSIANVSETDKKPKKKKNKNKKK
jgi:hypothetical protein